MSFFGNILCLTLDKFLFVLCHLSDSVTYGNKDAMGAGKSKKEAKHQAARNLIDKLTGVQIADQILPISNGNKE